MYINILGDANQIKNILSSKLKKFYHITSLFIRIYGLLFNKYVN